PDGQVYHVLNRSVGKMHRFGKDADFEAFQRVMIEAHQRHPIRILSYCVLSNHWHFAVWPEADGQVTAFFRWLAHTHAMRWRVAHRTVGYGHLYQGRFNTLPTMFKSAPQGGANKRGRTDSIHDANLLYSNLDAFHQGTDDLSPFMPACGGQAGLHPLPEVLEAL